jgi:hypothetical protein
MPGSQQLAIAARRMSRIVPATTDASCPLAWHGMQAVCQNGVTPVALIIYLSFKDRSPW